MKFKQYINEIINADVGAGGKHFEKVFMKACDLLDLQYEKNGVNGRGWDIKPIGDGWTRIINSRDVNIKVSNTKWLFSSTELTHIVPWDGVGDNYNEKNVINRIKELFKRLGLPSTVFLKPKTNTIQDKIIEAVKNKDISQLEKLFVSNNFYAEKLGRNYKIRISVRDNGKIGSIAIDKGGKVFMRSEKPRKMGGSVSVTFRTPTPKLSKKERPIKLR